MSNKKTLAIILSAVIVLSSVIGIAAYKIISLKSNTSLNSQTGPVITNSQMFIDTNDYSENLLDSNAVYKERFTEELKGQGKWIPVRASDLVKDLNNQSNEPVEYEEPPVDKYVGNENTATNEDYITDEIGTNITYDNPPSTNNTPQENGTSERDKALSVKIVYIWQPNCSTADWNPYREGRWEFTQFGWMWVSDYSWGNHCYNQGRWFWSSFYGWVWMPGSYWAPNWVTWRQCGNYTGWYPCTPRIWWRDYQSHLVICNPIAISNPHHWTFVSTSGITKKITKVSVVEPGRNPELLTKSEKIKTTHVLFTDDKQVKYNGPSVEQISKETKTEIIPTKVSVTDPRTKTEKNPPTKKVVNVKTQVINNVSSPTPVLESPGDRVKTDTPVTPKTLTTKTTTTAPPVKTQTKQETPTVKNEPTTKTGTSTTKSQEMPKKDPPKETPKKQEPVKQPPKKVDPPKFDTPKFDPPPAPKYEPPPAPKYEPPPTPKYEPPPPPPAPTKQDPPKVDPPPPAPTKQDPPPPPPPPKKDDGKKGD